MPTVRGPATPVLGIAAALLVVLGLVAAIYGLFVLGATNPIRPVVGIGTALLLLAYGAVLLAVGLAVFRGRRWSRGPAVAICLIQLPVAWSFAGGETWWVALSLAAVSIAVLVCLLVRSSTAVFVPDASGPDLPQSDPKAD